MTGCARFALRLAAAAAFLLAARAPGAAMPTFGQAYGVDCSKCHTQVPTLNAYGRYVQRSQYAYLDQPVLKKAMPLWVGYQANYDSQAGSPDTHRVVWGNVAVHAVGLVGDDWSYHVQQWIKSDNQGGGLDTAWVSYNNLFKHNGYVEIGKLEVPAPSPYSMWVEIAPFNTPEVTVGEHTYQLDANRWGAKAGYLHGSLSVDAAYVGSDADLNGASDFVPGNGKALQYRVAFMRPKNPLEAGLYGASGTFPISDGLTDRYTALAAYVQRDPTHGMPGVFLVYQTTHDSYPAAGATAPANGRGYTLDVYEPVFKNKVLVGFRREMTDDGMGTVSHYGNVDLTIQLAKYLRVYAEASLNGANPGNGVDRIGTPAWRAYVWWTMPVAKPKR
ncbi:MAG: hypothetical protein JO083_03760 [Candidatus Eremiobacteraeota bacterium]|nr:hypothetical protein [Candidatus Eremiobacteraeota bacterium]MBV8367906.1 hypothetical protein [Candidatus Eremiobacteraeota bacterium]